MTGAESDLASASSRARSWRTCRCSSAAIRSRPASAILHHLSRFKEYDVTTFQAEDEIAAICLGDRRQPMRGSLGVTCSSGPGIALKGEAMGLAIMTELPLVIVNSQRGGPSTGLPTKTEQSDLYQAVYGRNGDAPMPVDRRALAGRLRSTCAIEAVRIATQYMTPVMLLTDGYIANAAEPLDGAGPDAAMSRSRSSSSPKRRPRARFQPYGRDEKLKRPWVKPGTPGLLHRIGGIEKELDTGHINYAPANHQAMTDIRKDKIDGIKRSRPDRRTRRRGRGKLAVVGWGSTSGPIHQAVRRKRAEGLDVSHVHIRHIWPLPANLGELLQEL